MKFAWLPLSGCIALLSKLWIQRTPESCEPTKNAALGPRCIEENEQLHHNVPSTITLLEKSASVLKLKLRVDDPQYEVQ